MQVLSEDKAHLIFIVCILLYDIISCCFPVHTTNVYNYNESILIVYIGFIPNCCMFWSVLWAMITQSQ
jgi:hypothetical protein